jgi:hypothetical protein
MRNLTMDGRLEGVADMQTRFLRKDTKSARSLFLDIRDATIQGQVQTVHELLRQSHDIPEFHLGIRGKWYHDVSLVAKEATLLVIAVWFGQFAVLKVLLKHAEGVACSSERANWTFDPTHLWSQPAMPIAAYKGSTDILRHLIRLYPQGMEVTDSAGRSLLHLTAFYGHTTSTRLLLDADADPCAKANNGKTPEEFASSKYPELSEMIKVKRETTLRCRCMAFAMGLHPRLGGGSLVITLDAEVVKMVLKTGALVPEH